VQVCSQSSAVGASNSTSTQPFMFVNHQQMKAATEICVRNVRSCIMQLLLVGVP
jgi:hypothetical protein